jgi:hypothetical protein
MTLTHNLIERLLLLCFAWLVGLKGHWTILLEGVLYLVQFLLRAGVSSVFSNFAQGLVRSPLSVTKSHTMLSATGMWLAYLSMCPPIVFAFVWLYYLVVTVRRSSGLPKTPTWFKRFLTLICIAYVGEVVVEGIVKLVIISNAQTNQELLDRLATWVTTTVTPVILLVVYVCMVAVYLAFLRQTASLLALDKSSKHHGHLSNSGSAAAAAGGGGDGTVKPTGQGVTTGSTASVGDISVKQTFSPSGGVAPRSAWLASSAAAPATAAATPLSPHPPSATTSAASLAISINVSVPLTTTMTIDVSYIRAVLRRLGISLVLGALSGLLYVISAQAVGRASWSVPAPLMVIWGIIPVGNLLVIWNTYIPLIQWPFHFCRHAHTTLISASRH